MATNHRLQVVAIAAATGPGGVPRQVVTAAGLATKDPTTATWVCGIGDWRIGDLVDVAMPNIGELARPRDLPG